MVTKRNSKMKEYFLVCLACVYCNDISCHLLCKFVWTQKKSRKHNYEAKTWHQIQGYVNILKYLEKQSQAKKIHFNFTVGP